MIAVLFYGGFRSFRLNLLDNLHELFDEVIHPIHFYILTDYCEEYEIKKGEVMNIIKEFDKRNQCEITFFENIHTTSYYDQNIEDKIVEDYINIKTNHTKDVFTPKLIYRRCLINSIMNSLGGKYDKVIFARLFDMIYKRSKPLHFINDFTDNTLYFGIDTTFIGSQDDMNILFNNDLISNKIKIENMNEFSDFFSSYDSYLGKIIPICSCEAIFSSILFNQFKNKCKNIRFDFTKNNCIAHNEVCNSKNSKDKNEIIRIFEKYNTDDFLIIYFCQNRK